MDCCKRPGGDSLMCALLVGPVMHPDTEPCGCSCHTDKLTGDKLPSRIVQEVSATPERLGLIALREGLTTAGLIWWLARTVDAPAFERILRGWAGGSI
jgi:hypothetical protein